ncbi:MAG TPA: IPT/TIG domain-containing protein, partial [Acidimicrobiales bacterium]|nr:IPT/TIG domain-containing protein [Acidimicrobiales bacterium]
TSTASSLNSFTDTQFAHAYGLDNLYSEGDLAKGQTVGLFELDSFDMSDLAEFDKCYFGASHTGQVSVVNIDGGEPAGPGGGEAALDVEDVSAYAPDAHIDVYDAPGTLIGWAAEMLAIVGQDKASVINVSYGLCEADMQEVSPGFPQTENILMEEAALQGQTFVVASGDSGSETCYRNDGTTGLSVSDPAAQPYAVSVGGTSMTAATYPPVESVWNDGGTPVFGDNGAGGGGISTTWPMPAWQAGSRVPGIYNKYSTGSVCDAPAHADCREVPDVTASADELHGDTVVYAGQWTTIGGTSAAAPKWAAILAETNAYCAAKGLPAVGFAAPALYQIASNPQEYAEAFNDITSGNNDVLGLHRGAYPATKGYDMASGLGSPRVTGEKGTTGLTALLCGADKVVGHPRLTGISPDFGSYTGGTHVTVSGKGLTGVTDVQFGSASVAVSASDINKSGTSLTVVTPPSPTQPFDGHTPVGGVLVSVSGRNGTSDATLAAEFHYVSGSDSSPVPSVDFITPTSARAGATVTVYGSGFEEGLDGAKTPTVRFGGVASTAVTVVSDSQLRVKVPAETASTACATASLGVPKSSICQAEVTVGNAHGTSATQAILPPPSGAILDIFFPSPGEEVVPAVTEFDYAPPPVITRVVPSTVGAQINYNDPISTLDLQIDGSGFSYFTLQAIDVDVASDPSLDQSLLTFDINRDDLVVSAPVLAGPGAPSARRRLALPSTAALTIVAGGQTSDAKTLSIAPDDLKLTSISVHQGPVGGGTLVMVTGSHLNSVAEMAFDGQTAPGGSGSTDDITVVSADEIEFRTPSMPDESGYFLACDASECAGKPSTSGFTYYNPVKPTVTGINHASGTAGGGQTVTISGSGLSNVTAVYFGGSKDTDVSNPVTLLGTSTTEVNAVTPPGPIGATVPITVATLVGTSKKADVFFTYEKGAPGLVAGVTVALGKPGAIVSWKAPADGGSPLLGYRLLAHVYSPYQPSNVTYVPSASLPPSATSGALALPIFQQWTLEVQARSALGTSTYVIAHPVTGRLGDDGYAVASSYGSLVGYGCLALLPPGVTGTKPASPIVGATVAPGLASEWELEANGTVLNFGAPALGSLSPKAHATAVVAIASSPTSVGYWIATAGGGVYPFGQAHNEGELKSRPSSPIAGITPPPDGLGYWLVTADGVVYNFG